MCHDNASVGLFGDHPGGIGKPGHAPGVDAAKSLTAESFQAPGITHEEYGGTSDVGVVD